MTLFNEQNFKYKDKNYAFNFAGTGTLSYDLVIKVSDRGDGYNLLVDGESISSASASSQTTYNKSGTYAVGQGNHIFEMKFSYSVWYDSNNQTVSGTVSFSGSVPGKIGYLIPKEIIEIGEFGIFFSFGKSDNDFIGGIMLSKGTTATTGSVALGNAKGYIKVLFNGEIIKIPYYGD